MKSQKLVIATLSQIKSLNLVVAKNSNLAVLAKNYTFTVD